MKISDLSVDVFLNGAVSLGPRVVCDGFVDSYPVRVQTHIHDDHMAKFDKSKGFQQIVMSPETFDLLVAEKDADLPYRDNFHKVPRFTKYELEDGSILTLFPSNHMLGSCQVALQIANGPIVGYSGDFSWPLDDVIQVEQLVVDSTYGNPRSVRNYSQSQAENILFELVNSQLRFGPVHIKAFRGTIERVLNILSGGISVPILASHKLIKEIEVYQTHGFAPGDVLEINSKEGKSALDERAFVQLYSKGDPLPYEIVNGTSIVCSAYMTSPDDPLKKYSKRAFRVALSNHADFKGTIEYIKATGAKRIVTDNTRNHGGILAMEINNRIPGVFASPSTNRDTKY